MHRKSAAFAAVVLAVSPSLALIGCGSDDKGRAGTTAASSSSAAVTTEAVKAASAEAVVAEQGFTQKGDEAFFGVVLENKSPDAEALDISLTVNALDAQGNVLGTDNAEVSVIPPRKTFNVGGGIDVGDGRTKSIDVAVETGDSGKPVHPLPKVSNVRVERGEFGDVTIRAQVENTLDKPLSSITDVFAVLRNQSGEVVGGTNSYPMNDIQPGRKAAVDLNFMTGFKGLHSADVSVDNEISSSME